MSAVHQVPLEIVVEGTFEAMPGKICLDGLLVSEKVHFYASKPKWRVPLCNNI